MGEVDCKVNGNAIEVAPDSTAAKIKRRKSVKKKVVKKPSVMSPLKKLLKESETWTTSELDLFSNLPTSQERVEFVYHILPHDATSLDRLWPIQIVQKDSMIRRQLSDRGKECFLNGEWSKVLDFYNEAALFSTCKGLGHTMARRAAYLLQTGDIDLALRDIKMAFDLGCLERELMDFLLAHHTTDSDIRAANNDASVERSIEAMYNPDIANESKKYFSHKLRADLELIRTQQKGRPTEADVKNVMISLRTEAEKQQADKKDSVRCPFPKIRPPQIDRTNTRYPSFSEAVDVVVDMDKGRKVVAEKEIDIGEIIMTETPNTLFFCPEMEKLPLLKSHCLHCMSYTIAPIPCNECCVVTFCSLECQEAATYHVFECRMKLYEMLHFMGDEYASVFMAIRTITQKPAKYFWQRRDKILDILAMDYPEMRDESEIWSSDAIEPLLRLMSHQDEIEPEVLMKNAVIAVFFLRALQAVNYFEDVMPRKSKTDKRLKEPEALILYILNHLINTQSHNSTPFMRLVECADASNVCIKQDVGRRYFRWEYLGSSISSSLALINHSCDPNCIQFHVGRYAVLVPIRKISAGQEITIAYDKIHHEDQPLIHRQLHCLRKFYFSCECPACHNDWVSYEEMPDTLYLVPNFETEKHFVVRVGDKRDLVRDIERLKLKAEKEFRDGEVEKSIASMNELSEYLENDISKPHQYHIQANHVAILCVMTKFLKDVAKIVERTNFNKQFPPTYVNGEFVYTEKPTTVEESRYWEHGFVTPKPKKKKIVKKQKTTDSDESVQTIPDHVVKVELVNGASALGLNAGNGQPTEMNVNESLTEDEQTLRNAVEISNNSVINVDHELIANQDDVIEIKDNSVVLVDEKLASEENDQIGFVPLIAIQPQAQSQGHDHQPLGEIRSTNLEELQEMHPYGENSLMISNTMKEDSNIKDTIALRSDPPAKEHKPMNIPTDGLQEDVSNAKQKCNTSSELERLSSNLEVVENTPAIEVPLSQPTDTVQPNKPASDLLRNEHNNVENEPEHPSDQDNSFMVENETQLSLAKSIKTADENETMKQAQLNEINGGTRQEVDDKIGTFIPTIIEQGHQLSQVIIPVKYESQIECYLSEIPSIKNLGNEASRKTTSVNDNDKDISQSNEVKDETKNHVSSVNQIKDLNEPVLFQCNFVDGKNKQLIFKDDRSKTEDQHQVPNDISAKVSNEHLALKPSEKNHINEQVLSQPILIEDMSDQLTTEANSNRVRYQHEKSKATLVKDEDHQSPVKQDNSIKDEKEQITSKAKAISVQNVQDKRDQFGPKSDPIKNVDQCPPSKASSIKDNDSPLPTTKANTAKDDNPTKIEQFIPNNAREQITPKTILSTIENGQLPVKTNQIPSNTSPMTNNLVNAKHGLQEGKETKTLQSLPMEQSGSQVSTLISEVPVLKPKNIPPPPRTERIPPPPKLEKIKPPAVDEDLLRLCMLQIQQQVKVKPDLKVNDKDQDTNEARADPKHRQGRWL